MKKNKRLDYYLKIIYLTVASIVLFSHSLAQIQKPQIPLNQYTIDSWNEKDGIPQSTIKSIIQTKDGFLYFGNEEGLIRFDGESFKVFNSNSVKEIKENMVFSIAEDSSSNLWIATYDGLLKYSKGFFTRYSLKDGLSSLLIRVIYIDSKNRIWIGTNNGLNLFEKGRFTIFNEKNGLSSQNINCICEDKNGRIIIGTRGSGLNIYHDSKFISLNEKDGLLDDDVRSVFADSKNNIWIGSRARGIQLLQNSGALSAFDLKNEIFNNATVSHITEDASSNIWLSSSVGLIRISNGSIESLGIHNGYPFDKLNDTFIDREGSIWIATKGDGLYRLRDTYLKSISKLHGLATNGIRVLASDKFGNVWAGSESNYLSKISKDGISNFSIGHPSLIGSISSIIEYDNSILVGTNGNGVYQFYKGNASNIKISASKESNYVTSFYVDSKKRFWIGTDRGLYQFVNNQFVSFATDENSLKLRVRFITEDNAGNLWLGTMGRGLVKYNFDKYEYFSEKFDSLGNVIRSIYIDSEGIIWACSNRGLIMVRNNKPALITKSNGLFYDGGFSLLLDKAGYFWISCNLGIYKVKRKDLIAIADGRGKYLTSIVYGTDDGMPSQECNGGYQNSAIKAPDGSFWFATIKGIVVADPNKKEPDPLSIPVFIEDFKLDNRSISFSSGSFLNVEAGSNQIDISYTGVCFLKPQNVQFSYMLEGLNDEWSLPTTKRNVSYGHLSPGFYTFKVRAKNSLGIWSNKFAAVSFYVAPYFFQTYWFYLIIVLIIVVILTFIVRGKFKIQKIIAAELDKKVQERTNELNIEIKQKEIAQQEAEKYSDQLNEIIKKKDKFFSVVAHDLRNPLHAIVSTAEFLYSNRLNLTPQEQDRCTEIIYISSDRLNKLIENLLEWSRIQTGRFDYLINEFDLFNVVADAQNLLNANAYQKNIILENKLKPNMIVAADRNSIQSVVLNLLSNAIKFTHQYGIIIIDAIEDEDFVTVSIKDNGIGIPDDEIENVFVEGEKGSRKGTANEIGTGLGLTLCKEHVEKNGGRIWVNSKEGEGSEFCFILPKSSFYSN